MNRTKSVICVLLLVAILAVSGCSDDEASGSERAQVHDVPQTETGGQFQHMYKNSYIEYEGDFDGIPDLAYLPDTFCLVPVMPGDAVEISASVNDTARFLLGGEKLANHYIIGNTFNGVRGMEDNYKDEVIAWKGTEYYNVVGINNSRSFMLVFAVQDMNGGNGVMGHMKVQVYSSHTKSEHQDYYNAIMKNKIDALKAGNKILQTEIDRLERTEESRDWWIEHTFSYA